MYDSLFNQSDEPIDNLPEHLDCFFLLCDAGLFHIFF